MSLSDHIKQQGIPQFRHVYIRLNDLEQISQEDIEQLRANGSSDASGPCITAKYIIQCVQNRAGNGKISPSRDVIQPPGYFVQALERELSRIRRFVETFGEEIWVSLSSITDRISKWKSHFKSPRKSIQDDISLEELNTLSAQCDEIGDHIILLDEFLRQNVILAAFLAQKYDISIGSHDTLGGHKFNSLSQVSPAYLQALENYLMSGIHYDPILIGLSDAHSKIRQLHDRSVGADATWSAPDKFERKTTKYWVHPADVLRLKNEVIKHLPILIYGKDKERKSALKRLSLLKEQKITDWNLISSVYFDNDALDTYHERIRREHEAALIRLRWYGKQKFDMDDTIFIERKVHKDSWTGEKSVKERAPLPASEIPDMLRGKSTEGLQEDTPQAALLRDIQKRVVKEVPNLRTEYRRVAFQKSTSNEVRMSLDTHLRMIREKDAPCAKGDWCRDMRQRVDEKDVIHFPYAVFEIKLAQEDPPDWVQKILESGIIVEVPKFSKFLHGSALLFGEEVRNTPFWFLPDGKGFMSPATLEEMADTSDTYSKPPSFMFPNCREASPPIPRPHSSTPSGSQGMKVSTTCTVPNNSTTVLSEVVVMPSRGENTQLRSSVQEHTSHDSKRVFSRIAVGGTDTHASTDDNGKQKRKRRIFSWMDRSRWGNKRGCPESDMEAGVNKARTNALVRTRIEPKTFFANERTFLSWLSIAIIVMFMGLSLLDGANLGGLPGVGTGSGVAPGVADKCHNADGSTKASCNGAKISGALIVPVALILMMYALFVYRMRTVQILRRETLRYDDQRGPLLLTILLVVVLLIAFVVSMHFSF